MNGSELTGAVYCTSVKFQITAGKTRGPRAEDKEGQFRVKKSKKDKELPETPPELVVKPRRQFIDFGQVAKFKSSFDGSINTTVTWSKDGVDLVSDDHFKIYESDGYHYLEVGHVTIEDNGWYTCTVENPAGSDSASADLEVFEKPQLLSRSPMPVVPVWTRPLADLTASVGDQELQLECTSTDVVKPSVKWLHNGREVFSGFHMKTQHEGQTTTLTIKKVQEKDQGEFKCVMNGANGVLETSCVLTVKPAEKLEPPVFVKELHDMEVTDGDKLELVVEVKGTPPIRVFWFHNDDEVRDDSPDFLLASLGRVHTLTLPRSTPACSGQFVCEAYNDWGDTDTFCLVHVREVECPELPHFVTRPLTLSTREDESVTFSCQVQGQPLPSVVWEKGGVEITTSHKHTTADDQESHSLTIYKVDATDTGEYACHLHNSLGDATDLFYLHLDDDDRQSGPTTRKALATPDSMLPRMNDGEQKKINQESHSNETSDDTAMEKSTVRRYERSSRLAEFGDKSTNKNPQMSRLADKTKDVYTAKPIRVDRYGNLIPSNTSSQRDNGIADRSGQTSSFKGNNDVVRNGLRDLQMERNLRNVLSRTNQKTGSSGPPLNSVNAKEQPSGSQTHRNFTYHRSPQNPGISSIGLRTVNKSLSTLEKDDVTKATASEEQPLHSARQLRKEKKPVYSPSSSLQFVYEEDENATSTKENQDNKRSTDNTVFTIDSSTASVSIDNLCSNQNPGPLTETTYRAQITRTNPTLTTHSRSQNEKTVGITEEANQTYTNNTSLTSRPYRQQGENSTVAIRQKTENDRRSSLTTSGSVFAWDKSSMTTAREAWSESKPSKTVQQSDQSTEINRIVPRSQNANDRIRNKNDSCLPVASVSKPAQSERLAATKFSQNECQPPPSQSSFASSFNPTPAGKDDFRSVKLRPAVKGEVSKSSSHQKGSDLKKNQYMSKSTDNIFTQVKLKPVSIDSNEGRDSGATLSKATASRLRLKSKSSDLGEMSSDSHNYQDAVSSSSSLSKKSTLAPSKCNAFDTGQPPPSWKKEKTNSPAVSRSRYTKPNNESPLYTYREGKDSAHSVTPKHRETKENKDNISEVSQSEKSSLMEKIRQWKTTPDMNEKSGSLTDRNRSAAIHPLASPVVEGNSHLDRVPEWIKQKALNKRNSLQMDAKLSSSLKSLSDKDSEDNFKFNSTTIEPRKGDGIEGNSLSQTCSRFGSSKSLLPSKTALPTSDIHPKTAVSDQNMKRDKDQKPKDDTSSEKNVQSKLDMSEKRDIAAGVYSKPKPDRFGYECTKDATTDGKSSNCFSKDSKSGVGDDSWINRKPKENIEHLIRQKALGKSNKKLDEKPEWTKVRSPREIKLGNFSANDDGGQRETSSKFEFGRSYGNKSDQSLAQGSEQTVLKSASHNITNKKIDISDVKSVKDHEKLGFRSESESKSAHDSRLTKPKSRNAFQSPSSSNSFTSSVPSSSLASSSSSTTTVTPVNHASTSSEDSTSVPRQQTPAPSFSHSASSSSPQNQPTNKTHATITAKASQRINSETAIPNDLPSLKQITMRPSWKKAKSLRHIPIYPIQDNELSPRYEPFRATTLDDSSSTISTTSISSLASDASNLTTDSGYGKSVGAAELSGLISDSFDEKLPRPKQEGQESHDSSSTSILNAEGEEQPNALDDDIKDSLEDSSSYDAKRVSKQTVNSEEPSLDYKYNTRSYKTLNGNNISGSEIKKPNSSFEIKAEQSSSELPKGDCAIAGYQRAGQKTVSKWQSNYTDGDNKTQPTPRPARSEFLRNRLAKESSATKVNGTDSSFALSSSKFSTQTATVRPSNLDLSSPREPRIKATDVSRRITDNVDDSEECAAGNSSHRRSTDAKASLSKGISDNPSSAYLKLNDEIYSSSMHGHVKGAADAGESRTCDYRSDTASSSASVASEESFSERETSEFVSPFPRKRLDAAPNSTTSSANRDANEDRFARTREATEENQLTPESESFPSFVTPLVDTSVFYGSRAVLRCRVTGKPAPEVNWLHDRHPVKDSKDYDIHFAKLTGSAQLTLLETFTDHIGTYTCVATNALGSVCTSCRVTIETSNKSEGLALEGPVSLPPRIVSLNPRVATLTRRSTLTLTLTFVGEPSPAVKWIQGEKELTNDDRVNIATQRGSSVLSIAEVTAMDSGKISATVTSSIGSDHSSANVCVEDVPGAPVGKPHVYDITRDSASLSWCGPASSGGSKITYYVIEAKTRKQTTWDVLVPQCKELSHHIFGLQPTSTYQFRVRAANKQGLGPPSEPSERVITSDALSSSLTEESDGNSEVFTPSVEYRRRDELPFEPREVIMNTTDAFEDVYTTGEILGKGKFGVVYRCTEKSSGRVWAAKVLKCRGREKEAIKQEVDIMNRLHHPKLLMLWDAFESPRQMVLVMELIGAGELFERVIGEDFVLTERDCIHFLRQICEGVSYMHSCSVIHLDLKPENILCISENTNRIKIIDFGLARVFKPGDSFKAMVGTPEFIAPEVVNYEEINYSTDMWSVGVICYVLLSGLSPFLGDNDMETMSSVTIGEFDFEDEAFDEISDTAKDFISKLLVKRKEKRMTTQECQAHQWLGTDEVDGARYKRLNTDRLRHFMVRRKWLKTGNAVMAVSRLMKSSSLGSLGVNHINSSDHGGIDDPAGTPRSPSLNNVVEEAAMPTSTATDSHHSQVKQFDSPNEQSSHCNAVADSNNGDALSRDQNDNRIKEHSNQKEDANHNHHTHRNPSSFSPTVTSTQSSAQTNGVVSNSQHFPSPTPPLFACTMVDCKACAGDAARFDVVVTGEPTPEVSWYFEDDLIKSDAKYSLESNTVKGTKSLIIRTIEEDDEGEYFCKAHSSSGDVVCSAELSVLVM